MQYGDVHKMQVISNILGMQAVIGMQQGNINSLLKKSYDDLHEMQNGLVEKYNEAIKSRTKDDKMADGGLVGKSHSLSDYFPLIKL